MQTNQPQDRPEPSDHVAKVKYLLRAIWEGNQREMARSIGVSQALISHVVNGLRNPGRRLLEALASYPGINAEWLRSGNGQPLMIEEKGSLPIATVVLPGPPLRHPHLLSGSRHPIAESMHRATRYWISLAANSPVVRESSLHLAPGDLLLLEADPIWTNRPELTHGQLCGVGLRERSGAPYILGRVTFDPPVLSVQILGGSVHSPVKGGTATEVPSIDETKRGPRAIHPIPWQDLEERGFVITEEHKKKQKDREDKQKKNAEAAKEVIREQAVDGIPIPQEDIVAVVIYSVRSFCGSGLT